MTINAKDKHPLYFGLSKQHVHSKYTAYKLTGINELQFQKSRAIYPLLRLICNFTTQCLAITTNGSVGECSRLSQPFWLLGALCYGYTCLFTKHREKGGYITDRSCMVGWLLINSMKTKKIYKVCRSLTERFNATVVWCGLTGAQVEQVPGWEVRHVNPRWRWQCAWQPSWWYGQGHLCLKGKTRLSLLSFLIHPPISPD